MRSSSLTARALSMLPAAVAILTILTAPDPAQPAELMAVRTASEPAGTTSIVRILLALLLLGAVAHYNRARRPSRS